MKKIIFILIIALLVKNRTMAQATINPVGNANYIGLDKNLLFNATSRYQVTTTGTRQFNLPSLFNGSFNVDYISGFDGNPSNNVVIEISGLPAYHTQIGAFVGFTTRGFPPKDFKIEGYDVFASYNGWRTIADVNDNYNIIYTVATPPGEFTKLRFTFAQSTQDNGVYQGWIGLSELFFVHNEAVAAYDGLMVQYSSDGNVGIGTTDPKGYKLAVNGKIRAQEIKVETANWPDYVFAKDHQLPTLQETEKHIKDKGHLPGIPSAAEVKANGIDLGEMNAKLLQKIEELTLFIIDQNKEMQSVMSRLNFLEKK